MRERREDTGPQVQAFWPCGGSSDPITADYYKYPKVLLALKLVFFDAADKYDKFCEG